MVSTTDELDLPADEYAGTATVSTEDSTTEVEVQLRGFFEPLDGRFHWYGRIATNPELTDTVRSGATVVLATPHGQAAGKLSDVDPWGRFRVSGTGQPPF
jgi:hypothetical protein